MRYFGLFARRLTTFRISDAAAAAVEFAVAFPVLVLLAIGIADYARVYFTEITVANAARSGAEYGVKTGGVVDSMTYGALVEAGKDSVGMTVAAGTFCTCPSGGPPPDCLTGDCGTYGVPRAFDSVAVTKTVNFFLHYPGLRDSVVISRKSILRGH